MRRLALVLLAALALALVWMGVRVSWADAPYRAALDDSDTPAQDEPERLRAFETAAERRPGDFIYRLRCGQIRLIRAGSPASPDDELDRALEHLRAAVAAQPLDPRGRVTLARALALAGDAEGLVREASRAVVLGRRHNNVLLEATALYLAEWRRTGIQGLLVLALEVEAERGAWSSQKPLRTASTALGARGDEVVGDIVMAAAGRGDLLRAGAVLLRRVDSAGADVLVEQAEQAERLAQESP